MWKYSYSSGTQKTAPSKTRKRSKRKDLSSPRSLALTQGSPHLSCRPPRQPSAPEADPKPRSAPRPTTGARYTSHLLHKERYISAPSRTDRQPWTSLSGRRRRVHMRYPQSKPSLMAPPPSHVARRRMHHLRRKGDHPHPTHNRPPNGATRHPHRLVRPDACTQTCSKLSRRRWTRIETPSPE